MKSTDTSTTDMAASTPQSAWRLHRDAHGRLRLTLADGTVHDSVTPVRAFPIDAPDEGLSLMGLHGHEVLWIDRLSALGSEERTLIEQDLAVREFVPTVLRILTVSSFSTPSTWEVETDRGPAQLVLKAEEDIRRLAGRTHLLISASDGLQFRVRDTTALDRHSRRLLERFL